MPVCGCTPQVITAPVVNCDNCLVAKSLRYGCDGGPNPCGDTVVEDLSLLNDVTACTVSAVYSIVDYDADGFSAVSVTSGGSLSFTTSDNFVAYKEYEIVYRIDCPNSSLSTTAKVYVCMDNPCGQCLSQNGVCDPCIGTCLIQDNWAFTKPCGGSYTEDLTNANADQYILKSFDANGLENVSIAAITNILSYDTLSTAVVGSSYNIYYWVRTGTAYKEVKFTVTIQNMCNYVVCDTGDICDPCSGACIPNPEINVIIL
jgi:hypothetical protein